MSKPTKVSHINACLGDSKKGEQMWCIKVNTAAIIDVAKKKREKNF